MTSASCARARFVDLHFAARIRPAQERDLRDHLAACETCRTRYRRQLLLSSLDPAAVPARERLARGLGLQLRAPPRRFLAFAAAGLAAAVALALWPRAMTDSSFTARGGSADSPPPLVVYRLDAAGTAQPAGQWVRASDELAFAYRNPGARKFLLVFGVDEHRHVYWYHPEWTDPAQDPAAVRIAPAAGLVELPEAIGHRLDGTRLTIHALLLDTPIHVREVEQQLARGSSPVVPGAQEQVLTLEVRR